MSNKYGLIVRFTAKDAAGAAELDEFAEAAARKAQEEKGTLLYTAHKVFQPQTSDELVRVFYELYENEAAHAIHHERVKELFEKLKKHLVGGAPEITKLNVSVSTPMKQ